jgi:hypothetical protein
MATTHASHRHERRLTAPSLAAPHLTAPPAADPAARRRLRAVGDDGAAPDPVEQFLPPGATWLPAPPQAVPSLPGRPPMVGYLVLVPADRQPPFLREAPQPAFLTEGQDPDPRTATATATATAATSEAVGGAIRVDVLRRTAEVAGEPLDLTYLEFELLAHLVAHPHRVHTRDQLVATVWGYGHIGDGRTVDVHIARLRRKLGSEYRRTIQTVRRVGYRYTPPQED